MPSATNRVLIKSFSGGATIKDMCDFIKPILRKKPEKVILHLGTNNLRKGDAKSVADGIIKLPVVSSSVDILGSLFRQTSQDEMLYPLQAG